MSKDIFDKTIFDGYRVESLTESAQDIIPKYNFDGSTKTTVFISHKHDDLDETKGLIGLLERKYNIKAYIDSLDKSMPKKTSGETASKIKQRINRCNKFILLATNGAVESKWCNWELGYGDAQKFDTDNIALFPIKPDKTNDYDYKGNELPIGVIWTTNYDDLIEKAFDNVQKIVDVKSRNEHLSNTLANRECILYKMHGDKNNPNDAILIKDDYERYYKAHKQFLSALTGDLISKTFLFVGFSFQDPNLDYILSRIRVIKIC